MKWKGQSMPSCCPSAVSIGVPADAVKVDGVNGWYKATGEAIEWHSDTAQHALDFGAWLDAEHDAGRGQLDYAVWSFAGRREAMAIYTNGNMVTAKAYINAPEWWRCRCLELGVFDRAEWTSMINETTAQGLRWRINEGKHEVVRIAL